MGLGFLWDIGGQLFTRDFWGRILTDPLAAVRQHPELAAKSALVAGATVATGGLLLKAAPLVLGAGRALLTGAKVAATPVSFAVRHPVASFLLVTQADLPTEIVRAFGARRQAPAGTLPAPAPSAPPPATLTRAIPPQHAFRGGPVQEGAQWQALFAW